jgi:L-threonylcarbamoyladenylate synthase
VRQPGQPLVCRLLAALGFPVTGTSANRSGQPPLTAAAAVARELGEEVDLILEAGPTPGGQPSTIVDLTVSPPRLVRPGAISTATLKEALPEIFF